MILYRYHFVRTILSVPFCPLPFCPRTLSRQFACANNAFYLLPVKQLLDNTLPFRSVNTRCRPPSVWFIHSYYLYSDSSSPSFIHSGYFYNSDSSSPLLLRGAYSRSQMIVQKHES